jgi:hypothetical protein
MSVVIFARKMQAFIDAAKGLKSNVARWYFNEWSFTATVVAGVATFTNVQAITAPGNKDWYISAIEGGLDYPVAFPALPIGIEFRINEAGEDYNWVRNYFKMADICGGTLQTPRQITAPFGYLLPQLGELNLELRQNTAVVIPNGTFYGWIRVCGVLLPHQEENARC